MISVDPVHKHMEREIDEIWIPELRACFNEEGFVFKSDGPREYGYVETEIDDEAFTLIHEYLQKQEAINTVKEMMF